MTPHVIDPDVAIGEDHSTNSLIFKHYQEIPDDFISDLKAGRMDSLNTRSGDMLHVMSVPVAVIEHIKRDLGYDMMEEPIRRSIQLLKALHLDAFLVTDKQI